MLTGDVPFDGDTPVAVAIKHLQEQPEYPRDLAPEIPEGLADIVMKSKFIINIDSKNRRFLIFQLFTYKAKQE